MNRQVSRASVVVLLIGLALTLALAATVGAQGWLQLNQSGFGDPANSAVSCLAVLGSELYASTTNYESGANLWRKQGLDWTAVSTGGFGVTDNGNINHLITFRGQLYASTENSVTGGEVWRTANGTDWTPVAHGGFGDATNAEVFRFAVFGDKLYVSTISYSEAHGGEIWCTATGNTDDWTRVANNGFGDRHNVGVLSFAEHNGYLYAGTNSLVWADFGSTGGEVWRSNDGTRWAQVNTDGFGTVANSTVSALASFRGYLYASTVTPNGRGAEVWRCQSCDGRDWTRVVANGFDNPDSRSMSAMEVHNGHLHLVLSNRSAGLVVWRTPNGTDWEQVAANGFGHADNWGPYWDSSVTTFNNGLYVGTWNPAAGGEVWLLLDQMAFLPVVIKH